MTHDIELLRRYAENGSEEAFTELVGRHIDFVYAAAFRQTRSTHRAEDIAQIVFTDLARKAGGLTRRAELLGWLYISTHYAATAVIRSEARRAVREQEAQLSQDISADPDGATDWQPLHAILDGALRDLNEVDRTVILLRYFKSRSFADIGAALRLTEEAARKRADRALEKLRPLLARRGVTSTTAALMMALASQAGVAAPAGLAVTVTGSALTGATGAGATAAMSFLNFMSATKTASGIATIVTLLAIASAGYQFKIAHDSAALLTSVTRERNALQAQLAMAKNRVRLLEDRQSKLEQTLQQQRTTAEDAKVALDEQAAKAAEARRNAAAKALADGQAFLAAYGQTHDMLLTIGKAQIARKFAGLIESGAITPEQIDRLENKMAEHWIQSISLTPTRIHPSDENLPDDQLKDILGDQGFQQFQNYKRIQPLQGLVNDISSLSISAPINPSQYTQLLNVLANASSSYASGGKADPQSVDWNQVLPQAQGILSEAQINALKAESQLFQLDPLMEQFYQNQQPPK